MRGDSNLSDSDFFRSQNLIKQKYKKIYDFDKIFNVKKPEQKKSFFRKLLDFIKGE